MNLLRLCDQAQQRSVPEVNYEIRQGNIRQQLRQLVLETDDGILVMGMPMRGFGRSIFTPRELHTFTKALEAASQMQVIMAAPHID